MTATRIEVSSSAAPWAGGPATPSRRSLAGLTAAVTAAAAATWAVGVPAVVIGGACALLVIALWRSYSAAGRLDRPGPEEEAERHWVITDEEVQVSRTHSVTTWRWPAVVRVDVLPGHYLLHPERGRPLDVPREPLTDAQDAGLRAILALWNLHSK
ncbi:YcxB family protein [Actinoplanes sp. NPDC049548]|uniref:YcxB family protein n=1 Tax=Actinoplanes sp. NPDC049548 TaxID=3155152 RepID=UPI003448C041